LDYSLEDRCRKHNLHSKKGKIGDYYKVDTGVLPVTQQINRLIKRRRIERMGKVNPKAIDLFSGCGGLTLGLKWAGFEVIGAVELDPLAVESFKQNHTAVKVWQSDISNLNPSEVMQTLEIKKGELDLLSGCPPCQGFSSIRTRNGNNNIADPRNDLVFDFLRFIEEFQPKTFMMENVPGLAEDERMMYFRNVVERAGYTYECEILDAADYGVPQRRNRMVLIGARSSEIGFPSALPTKKTVRDAIASLPKAGESLDPLHDLQTKHTDRVLEIIKRIPKNGGSRTDLDHQYQLDCHKNFEGFEDVYGRMSWDKVSPTITGGCYTPSKGRFLHPEEDRVISLREATLLQSFPLDYKISLKRGKLKAAVQIGNAWPPEFIKHIASNINLYLSGSPDRK
jgi:DNA (cytosine-5)-methyltransferase 1